MKIYAKFILDIYIEHIKLQNTEMPIALVVLTNSHSNTNKIVIVPDNGIKCTT